MPFSMQTWDLPIPIATFQKLCDYRAETQCRAEMSEIVTEAVNQWLEKKQAQRVRGRSPLRPVSGYQWKRLFLPDGTILRTHFRQQHFRAKVERSRIVFNGTAVSPNDFTRVGGGSNRNAWKAIWLLFPGERDWRLADDCRVAAPQRRSAKASASTSLAT
jgi:hypothetical protein